MARGQVGERDGRRRPASSRGRSSSRGASGSAAPRRAAPQQHPGGPAQGPTWQPLAILVLLVALVGCVVALTFFGPSDDVDHVAAGDYVGADGSATTAQTGQGSSSQPVAGAQAHEATSDAGQPMVLLDEGRTTQSGTGRVSVAAFGGTVVGDSLLSLADGWAGQTGDGSYDFSPLYAQLSSTIGSYDIALTDEVGTLGGSSVGFSGYPLYNTPDSLADALAGAGFRVVNINNGHVLDHGQQAALAAVGTWGQRTGLLAIGSYASDDDAARVRVAECNGVRVAFLSFSTYATLYGDATGAPSCLAVPASEDEISSQVAAARRAADAVVVYAHWGNDATHELSQEQLSWAQALADAGADVVVGCGSREVQSVAWLTGSSGGRTLVAYGLGALVSGYSGVDQALSGMLSFDLVKAEDGSVTVADPTWHAIVEHRAGTTDAAYALSDYSEELASQNELLAYDTDPWASLSTVTERVVGNAVTVAS